MSNVIPPEVRTRCLGRRVFAVTVAIALWLFLASRWLDLMNKAFRVTSGSANTSPLRRTAAPGLR